MKKFDLRALALIPRADLRALVVAWCLALTGTAAFAATGLAAPESFDQMPWVTIAGCCAVSLLAGLANTLREVDLAAQEGKPVIVKTRIAKDLVVSCVIGMLVWAAIVEAKSSFTTLIVWLLIGGYGGAKVLDPLVATLSEWIARVTGKGPHQPPPPPNT